MAATKTATMDCKSRSRVQRAREAGDAAEGQRLPDGQFGWFTQSRPMKPRGDTRGQWKFKAERRAGELQSPARTHAPGGAAEAGCPGCGCGGATTTGSGKRSFITSSTSTST